MHKNKDDISNTAIIIKIALENTATSIPSIFLDRRVLSDPPFALFQEIIKFLANAKPSVKWESLFLTLDCSCKQNQQLFLLRLLALVSRVNGVHYDVFLSPATILSQDGSAQILLQALATSTMVSEEVMSAAVTYVLGEGDAAIYKKGVKTRNAICLLQAACRYWIGRRRRRKALASSIDALLARKSKIEEDIEEAEARLQEENGKIIRILRLKDTHRRTSQDNISQPLHHSRPRSAPLPNNPSQSSSSYPQDEKFADSVIDISDIQSRMKRKERALFERERKLKERHVKAKNKEAELKLDEQRISELTTKIRKQQIQMKEQKLQLERSKAMSVTSTPEPATNSSQPCSVCIERKHHMRTAKAKFKQQVRLLNSMKEELKKREMLLAEREAASQKEHHKKLEGSIPKSTAHPPKRQKRRNDEVNESVSPHEDNVKNTEQCSHIEAMVVEDDEDGKEEELQVEALTPRSEELLPSEKEEPSRHSHSKQTSVPRNNPKMTTSLHKNASNHCKQRQKDETSQSNVPQPTQNKHNFTFEKNHKGGDDGLDYADSQLRCAVKSLRELI